MSRFIETIRLQDGVANNLGYHAERMNRSVEEIHQITGLGAAAIKVRAFRARQKMKAHLTKLGGGRNL